MKHHITFRFATYHASQPIYDAHKYWSRRVWSGSAQKYIYLCMIALPATCLAHVVMIPVDNFVFWNDFLYNSFHVGEQIFPKTHLIAWRSSLKICHFVVWFQDFKTVRQAIAMRQLIHKCEYIYIIPWDTRLMIYELWTIDLCNYAWHIVGYLENYIAYIRSGGIWKCDWIRVCVVQNCFFNSPAKFLEELSLYYKILQRKCCTSSKYYK